MEIETIDSRTFAKGKLVKMGMIATILSLFGCTGQEKQNDSGLSKEMEMQLHSSIEAFRNRPIHKVLTDEIIDTTSDENLLQTVFDNLSCSQSADYKTEYEMVMSWNTSRQAIYIIWGLEAEVNNGGYNQFYSNSSGQFYKHLPQALRLVGAERFADLTERANNTFEKDNDKITEHQDGTIEGFSKSYDNNPLNKYDDEFFDLYKTEDLQQIQVDFIRRHKSDFVNR